MNIFDAVVYFVGIVAIISGFNAGLLRSVATIIGYLAAMPIALAATPLVASAFADKLGASGGPGTQNSLVFLGVFLLAGIALSAALRAAISEVTGTGVSLVDRFAGSVLGAVRVVLVAVTMILIFDRIIPADRQPAFLKGSQLRPILLMVGQKGLKSLPPDITALIDQLKRQQRI
jgi:membrane protein required for colicin V production